MRPLFLLLMCLATAGADPFAELIRPTGPLTPQEEQTKLHVPPGFSVQLFASEPMINKPINLAFDDGGRLWVTSTTEYPFPAAKERWEDAIGSRVRDSRDAIKILTDTDGDGRADQAVDFADGLNVPIGVLPYKQGCIAWSIPNIWYFADTDGDGKCDQRTVLFGPLGYEKDTHGNIASLRMGADGWVYATHGFSNVSHLEVRPENLHGRKLGDPGTTLNMESGNVFRFRPDGSAVELWAAGQVNPFGLCWDSWGNLYSADCHSNPLTLLLRGAIYPSFGRPDDGLGFGPVLCAHTHGSTGLCGVLYLERDEWGPEWNDHMLMGNCVTSRINRDKIVWNGATPRAVEQEDFLVPEDPWFRPVDLQMGPDHALYVADFYNKIIGHYEVDRNHPGRDRERGRIWRIVKNGARKPAALGAEDRVKSQHWRFTKATLSFKDLDEAAAILKNPAEPAPLKRTVVEAMGAAPDASMARSLLTLLAASDPADIFLRHTLKIALRSVLRLPGALAKLPPENEEVAVIVLGIDSAEANRWSLHYLMAHPDHQGALLPSLVMLARKLQAESVADLVALTQKAYTNDIDSQMQVLQALTERSAALAPGLIEWGEKLAEEKLRSLDERTPMGWQMSGTVDVATFGIDTRPCADGQPAVVLSSLAPPYSAAGEKRVGTLKSVPFARPDRLSFWLCGHLGNTNAAPHNKNFVRLVEVATGKEIRRALPPRIDVAQQVVWDLANELEGEVRLEITDGDDGESYAWLALGRLEPPVVPLAFSGKSDGLQKLAQLVTALKLEAMAAPLAQAFGQDDLTGSARSAVAQALQSFPAQRPLLVRLFKKAPGSQQAVLAAALASSREGAWELIAMAPPRLLADPQLAQKLAALQDAALSTKLATLTRDLVPNNAETDALLMSRFQGYIKAKAEGKADAAAGRAVFQTNCAACHQLEGAGQVVGPQLDGAKQRGAERLCEDILDPNRAVDPAFRLHFLKLQDRSIVSGLQRREEGNFLILANLAGQEQRVGKVTIVENTESPLSFMPPVFGQSIPESDFYHLLAYLLEH